MASINFKMSEHWAVNLFLISRLLKDWYKFSKVLRMLNMLLLKLLTNLKSKFSKYQKMMLSKTITEIIIKYNFQFIYQFIYNLFNLWIQKTKIKIL